MTKRERAAVVELLRCAADCHDMYFVPISRAAESLGIEVYGYLWYCARDARIAAQGELLWLDGRAALLEAALRVEQGEWPCR